MSQDELKLSVARAALDYIPDGKVIGVGTGSTANFFIDAKYGLITNGIINSSHPQSSL